jgi:hypothetical protein
LSSDRRAIECPKPGKTIPCDQRLFQFSAPPLMGPPGHSKTNRRYGDPGRRPAAPARPRDLTCRDIPSGYGRAAAGLIMHKWVTGWHTPEPQSESTLHVAPTGRPEAFGTDLSLGWLAPEPPSEFIPGVGFGGSAAAGLIMHKWVTGWHTPDVQSEFTLHLEPTLPGACASTVLQVVTAPVTQIAEMAVVKHDRHFRLAMLAGEILISMP